MVETFDNFFSFSCDFSLENDYQKLCLQVKCNHESKDVSISYKVLESVNIDFIPVSKEWIFYNGDCQVWLNSFISLHTNEWKPFYQVKTELFSDFKVKWNLKVKRVHGTAIKDTLQYSYAVEGLNDYPENFTDFLELLRLLLNIPVFLIEL